MLQFTSHTKAGSQTIAYTPAYLVIAGWAARRRRHTGMAHSVFCFESSPFQRPANRETV